MCVHAVDGARRIVRKGKGAVGTQAAQRFTFVERSDVELQIVDGVRRGRVVGSRNQVHVASSSDHRNVGRARVDGARGLHGTRIVHVGVGVDAVILGVRGSVAEKVAHSDPLSARYRTKEV